MQVNGALQALDTALAAVDAVLGDRSTDDGLRSLVGGLTRIERQLSARRLAAVQEQVRRAKARGEHPDRAARNQLQADGKLTPGEAKRTTETAKALGELPATREALGAGRISQRHAEAIARAARRTTDQSARVELDRVGANVAATTNGRHLRRALDEVLARRAPDEEDDREAEAVRNRTARTWDTDRGTVAGRFEMPKHYGEALRTALNALAMPHSKDDDRTLEQRQADALTKLATDALDRGEVGESRGFRPHISLIVDLSGDVDDAPPGGMLDFSGRVSNQMVRRLGCDAGVARALTNSPSQVLDMGRSRRTATAAQRRALVVRDRQCIGCGAPAGWCEAHHIKWWRRDNGRTDVDNLTLVCWACHDKIHFLGWTVVTRPDGSHALSPPDPATAEARPATDHEVANEGLERAGHRSPSRPDTRGTAGAARRRRDATDPLPAGSRPRSPALARLGPTGSRPRAGRAGLPPADP